MRGRQNSSIMCKTQHSTPTLYPVIVHTVFTYPYPPQHPRSVNSKRSNLTHGQKRNYHSSHNHVTRLGSVSQSPDCWPRELTLVSYLSNYCQRSYCHRSVTAKNHPHWIHSKIFYTKIAQSWSASMFLSTAETVRTIRDGSLGCPYHSLLWSVSLSVSLSLSFCLCLSVCLSLCVSLS